MSSIVSSQRSYDAYFIFLSAAKPKWHGLQNTNEIAALQLYRLDPPLTFFTPPPAFSKDIFWRQLAIFFWRQSATYRSLHYAPYRDSKGERSCLRSATAFHSVAVDRTPNLQVEKRTLWTIRPDSSGFISHSYSGLFRFWVFLLAFPPWTVRSQPFAELEGFKKIRGSAWALFSPKYWSLRTGPANVLQRDKPVNQ